MSEQELPSELSNLHEKPPPPEPFEWGHIDQTADEIKMEYPKYERGLCWAASSAMAIQGLTGISSKEALHKVINMSEAFGASFADTMEEMRDLDIPAPPFMERARPYLVDSTGGLEDYYLEKYPAETQNLLTYLFQKEQIPVGVELESYYYEDSDSLIKRLKSGIQKGKVPVLKVHVHRDDGSYGHMVAVKGYTEGESGGFFISNPSLDEPTHMSEIRMRQMADLGYDHNHEALPVTVDVQMPIIWFKSVEAENN